MGDEDQRGAASLGYALDDAQHAILRGGIQRGGWFIADEQIGVAGHGHGNEHALALAAGELMWESGGNVGIKLHLFESGCGIAHPGLSQLLAHAHKRIQRAHRFLENHGHGLPAQGADAGIACADYFVAIHGDGAARAYPIG